MIHAEVARYYRDLAPDYFQVLERFAEQLATEAPAIESATLLFVAEAEGQVVGPLLPGVCRQRSQRNGNHARAWSEESAYRVPCRRRGEPQERRRHAPCRSGRGVGAGRWRDDLGNDDLPGKPPLGSVLGERMSYEELSVNLRKPL